MKQIASFLSLLSILLLFGCDAPKEEAAESAPAKVEQPAVRSGAGAKVAYVHIDSLASQYQFFKELEEEILAERMSMENQFQQEVNRLEQDYKDAQREAASLTENQLQILQQKLAAREQRVMQQKQDMESALLASEQEKTTAYFNRVRDFLDKYAKENGYDVIYGHNDMDNILFINDAFDVTDEVVRALNAEYETASNDIE